MAGNDISQIKVGTDRIGIIGLKQVLSDLAAASETMSEEDIKKHLVESLGKKNYFPASARERYEKAFYREFCRYVGKPVDEEREPGVIEIKVLGQGCFRCDQLEQDVMDIVAEMNVRADIEHVRDIKAIAGYGVLGSPALVVNGQVKAVGNLPGRHKIMAWIKEASENK